MSDINRVTLAVNGAAYGGWKRVRITAGIERMARDFVLEVTDRWPGANASSLARRIRPGDVCEVRIGPDLVLTGYVDATPIRHDAREVSVSIEGRSKTADLVDCSAINEPGQWRGQKIERVVADLASPYGVRVRAEVDTGSAVADHQIQQGETVAESIDRLMRIRRLVATDTAAGELRLIDIGTTRASVALVVGGPEGNVKGAEGGPDFRDRYSEYVCKGQRAGDDLDDADTMAGESASNADAVVPRRRVLLIKQAGQADGGTCRDRVDYERDVRAGKSLASRYTVAGWRQGLTGALWVPNQLVHVRDPIIGFDREMLIAEVEYSLGEDGTLCVLKVAPPEAFRVAQWKKKAGKKAAGAEVSGIDEYIDLTRGIQ